MYELDLSSIVGFLSAAWQVTSGVLRLDSAAFLAVLQTEGGTALALFILFVAGVSDTLGQSVVLFANRVSRPRFVATLIVRGLALIVTVFLWAASIWLTADYVFGGAASFATVLVLVMLSHAPLVLGFLVLLPYLGTPIYHLLRIWVLLAVVITVIGLYGFGLISAFISSVMGWMLLEVLNRMPLLQVRQIDEWLWRVSTGRQQQQSADAVVEAFVRGDQRSDRQEGGSG